MLIELPPQKTGDPWESRTPVWGVRGPRLDHLTNGPFALFPHPQNRTMILLNIHKALPAQFCRSSPRAISTGQLHTLLHFHLRPINQIVFLGPYSIKDERSYLRESFTLRCFQRLSRPYLATQLCPWQNNWCTRGTSIPVLSY